MTTVKKKTKRKKAQYKKKKKSMTKVGGGAGPMYEAKVIADYLSTTQGVVETSHRHDEKFLRKILSDLAERIEKLEALRQFDDMKVASYNYDGWGDVDDPKSDWSILNSSNDDRCIFSHKDACEFILYVNVDNWKEWESTGYSAELIKLAKTAKAQGYKYLCLYG